MPVEPTWEETAVAEPTWEETEAPEFKEVREAAPLLAPGGEVTRFVRPGSLLADQILPAIRKIGGAIVPGKKGDTHPDIIDRHGISALDIDQRGFLAPNGEFLDREAAAQGTLLPTEREPGRLHSTDLQKPAPAMAIGPMGFIPPPSMIAPSAEPAEKPQPPAFEEPLAITDQGPIFKSAIEAREQARFGVIKPPEPTKLSELTGIPPETLERIRRSRYGRGILGPTPEERAAGVMPEQQPGILPIALSVPAPFAPGPETMIGKAMLAGFTAQFAKQSPEAWRAFSEAASRGDWKEAGTIAVEWGFGAAFSALAVKGLHEELRRWSTTADQAGARLEQERAKGPVEPDTEAKIIARKERIRQRGRTPEDMVLFTGMDVDVAGTTHEKVAALAAELGIRYEPKAPPAEPEAPAAPAPAPKPAPVAPAPAGAAVAPSVPAKPAAGMVRLYSGGGSSWFTRNPQRAATFGPVVSVEVPAEVAAAAEKEAQKSGSFTPGDALLPNEWVNKAQPFKVEGKITEVLQHPVDILAGALDSPTVPGEERKRLVTQTGLALTTTQDLDRLIALREKYAAIIKDGTTPTAQRMAATFNAQAAREAFEIATDSGSQVESEIKPSLPKYGPRALDWKAKPEVAEWMRKNADRLTRAGFHLPEGLTAGAPPTVKPPPGRLVEVPTGVQPIRAERNEIVRLLKTLEEEDAQGTLYPKEGKEDTVKRLRARLAEIEQALMTGKPLAPRIRRPPPVVAPPVAPPVAPAPPPVPVAPVPPVAVAPPVVAPKPKVPVPEGMPENLAVVPELPDPDTLTIDQVRRIHGQLIERKAAILARYEAAGKEMDKVRARISAGVRNFTERQKLEDQDKDLAAERVGLDRAREQLNPLIGNYAGSIGIARMRAEAAAVKGIPQPMGTQKITGKVLKIQKENLLKQLDAAIKAAPKEGKEKITISVPGDGDFTITNTKDALKTFRTLAEDQLPETVGGIEGPQLPSPKGKGIPTVKEIVPVKIPALIGKFVSTDKTRFTINASYSDGTQIVATDGRQLIRVVNDKLPGTPTEPVRLTPKGQIDKEAEGRFPNWKIVRDPNPKLLYGGMDTGQLLHIIRQAQVFRDTSVEEKKRAGYSVQLFVNPDRSLGGRMEILGDAFEHNVQPNALNLGSYNPDYLANALITARKLGNERVDVYAHSGADGPLGMIGKSHESLTMAMRGKANAPLRDDPDKFAAVSGRAEHGQLPEGWGPLTNPLMLLTEYSELAGIGKFQSALEGDTLKYSKIKTYEHDRTKTYEEEVGTLKVSEFPEGEKSRRKVLEGVAQAYLGEKSQNIKGLSNALLRDTEKLLSERLKLQEEVKDRARQMKEAPPLPTPPPASDPTKGPGEETALEALHNTLSGLPPGVPDGGPGFAAELLEASRRLETLVRSRTTLPPGVLGRYVLAKAAIMQADRIEVGDIRNQATVAHEEGHDLDALLFPAQFPGTSQKSLAARIGHADKKVLFKELVSISELMRGPIATGSPGHQAYRKRAVELIADFFSLYAHDPARARAMAPEWTAGFERVLQANAGAAETIRQLLAGNVQPVAPTPAGPGAGPTPAGGIRMPGALPPRMAAPTPREAAAAVAAENLVKGSIRLYEAEVQRARIRGENWREDVPNTQDRNDVGAFVEGTGNLEIPGDTRDAVIARMTPNKQQLAKDYRFHIELQRQRVNELLKDYTQGEYLKFLEDYLPHFYLNSRSPAGQSAMAKFIKNSPNAKQRKIPTFREAIEYGLVPITQDPTILYELHARINWRVATNRLFLAKLKTVTTSAGEPVIRPAGQNPGGWPVSNNPLIQKVYARMGRGGLTLWRGGAAIHPDIWHAVRQILETPTRSDPARIYDAINGFLRANAFAFSLFHDITLRSASLGAEMKLANPLRGLFRLFERDPASGDLKLFESTRAAGKALMKEEDAVADAALHGLKFAWTESESYQHAARDTLEKLAVKLREVPFLGKTARLARDIQHLRQEGLWRNTHDAFKILAYHDLVGKALADAPAGTDEKQVKERIASLLNDCFGGQEWQTKFWMSPQVRMNVARFWLAPDWTLSTLRSIPFMSDVFSVTRGQVARLGGRGPEPTPKEGWKGNIGRGRFWIAELTALALATIAAQYAIFRALGKKEKGDRPWIWDNELGQNRRIDVTPIMRQLPWRDPNDPTRYYVNLGKRPEEILHWFLQPEMNVQSKMARPLIEVVRQLTGSEGDFKAEWKREHETFIESLPERAKSAAGQALPFVFMGNQFALSVPFRKGMTRYKSQQAFESAYEVIAEPSTIKRYGKAALRGTPSGNMDRLLVEIRDASERNGVNADAVERIALSTVRGQHYHNYFRAYQKNDKAAMEKEADALERLGIGGAQIQRNIERREKQLPGFTV